MAGRTPHEAVASYLEPMTKAVSCVTDTVLNISGGYDQSREHLAVLGSGDAIKLNGSPFSLRVLQSYRVVEAADERGPFKVQVTGYSYALHDAGSQQEILAYHWHPRSEVTWPHLYLGPGARVGFAALAVTHLPTGRIAVEDFIQVTIEAFGAKPTRGDWLAVLEDSRERFRRWRTWG